MKKKGEFHLQLLSKSYEINDHEIFRNTLKMEQSLLYEALNKILEVA